jgi:hypothetical protein
MVQAGQTMQKQYETGMDALQQVYDDTYNIKYIPGSKDEQYVKQHVIPAAKEIFSKYISQDMGDPMVRRHAIMDLNSKIDKQKINKIQESHAGWMTHQQDKRKLALDNQLDPDEQDYGVGYDTDTRGVYNKQSSAYVDPILEFRKTYTEPIKDSTISESRDNLGNVRIKYGLDEKGLQDVVNSNIGNIRGSKLGDRLFRSYTRRYGIDSSELNEQQRDQILRKAMFEAGKPDLRDNVKYDRLAVPDTGSGSGDKPVASSPISMSPRISLAGTKQDEGPEVSEITGVKKQGWLSKVIDNATTATKESKTGIPTSLKSIVKIFATGDRNIIKEEDKTPDYKKVEEQAVSKYNYAGNDPKQKTKLVKDYIDEFYTDPKSLPVFELPEKILKSENYLLENNMVTNRAFWNPENPLTQDNKIQYSQILEEYPKDKYKHVIIGGTSNNNPMSPSVNQYSIYSVDDKGNTTGLERTYYMEGPEQDKSFNDFAWKFHGINYDVKGEREYETSIPGLGVKAKVKQKREYLSDVNSKQTYPTYDTEIKFNIQGSPHTFKGDFNTTEEALSAFSQYVKGLNIQ